MDDSVSLLEKFETISLDQMLNRVGEILDDFLKGQGVSELGAVRLKKEYLEERKRLLLHILSFASYGRDYPIDVAFGINNKKENNRFEMILPDEWFSLMIDYDKKVAVPVGKTKPAYKQLRFLDKQWLFESDLEKQEDLLWEYLAKKSNDSESYSKLPYPEYSISADLLSVVSHSASDTPPVPDVTTPSPPKKQNKIETLKRNNLWRETAKKLLGKDPSRTVRDIANEIWRDKIGVAADREVTVETIYRELRGIKPPPATP